MNKEKLSDYIHKVFFFDHRKNVKEFSKDSTLTNIVQTQRFPCLFICWFPSLHLTF